MHKNKYNKLCKTNEKITIEWKMIDEKTIKTYIGFNETIRKKWMKGRNMMKRGLAAFLTMPRSERERTAIYATRCRSRGF